jgi:poly(3-hydroxybutyrate) depolymerase
MTTVQALVFGTLMVLGCSSSASDASDEPPLDESEGGQAGPMIPGGAGGSTSGQAPGLPNVTPGSSNPPNASTGSPEASPSPVLQPPGEPSSEGQPGPSQAPGEQTPPVTAGAGPTIPAVTEECPTFQTGTITFMGLRGIQIVAGPKPEAATAPIVFYWHGTGSTSGEFARLAGAVSSGVEAEGGILVSFQGTTGGDALSGTSVFGRGDLELVDQLAACAVRDHNVDPRRIFTTGCSAGGLFATNLAVLRSEYIAAAAPNSGGLTFPQQFQSDYTPALMTVHGAPGRDVVIVDFSNTSATADRTFSGRGGFVVNCNHGGGHCGGGGLASDVWEFFEAHPYGVEPAPSPWTSGLPSGFSSDCEIFSSP